MWQEIEISGYRCFSTFKASGLGRVNLFVGRNNSGKTAFLEAVQLLSSPGYRAQRLLAPLSRRGERFSEDEEGARRREYDVSHLFHGHKMDIGSGFSISARDTMGSLEHVQAQVIEDVREGRLFEDEGEPAEGLERGCTALRLESTGPDDALVLPLSWRGGLHPRSILALRPPHDSSARDATFVTTDSLTSNTASQYWKSIALTAEEDLVLESLRILDESIERVAFVGERHRLEERGGLLVKQRGSQKPVPIGSLGDGMWRMFCIATALIRARNSTLLVDEIDTGLHYSAMESMWWLVLQTAERLDVQVFATTHSFDCINSLAVLCRGAHPGKASLQRVEAEKKSTVAYSESEIWAAAQHGIEAR
jgi:hypothetical protein